MSQTEPGPEVDGGSTADPAVPPVPSQPSVPNQSPGESTADAQQQPDQPSVQIADERAAPASDEGITSEPQTSPPAEFPSVPPPSPASPTSPPQAQEAFVPMVPDLVRESVPNPAAPRPQPSSEPEGARSPGGEAPQQEGLTRLETQLGELLRLRKRDVDVIDRLHSENQSLRAGEFVKSVTPMHNALLRLHDQMMSEASKQPPTDPKAAEAVLFYAKQLAQILDLSAGLQVIDPVEGTSFDARIHAGVGIRLTDDPARVGTIAVTVKPGFRRSDRTIARAAEVEVYQPAAPAPAPAPASAPAAAPQSPNPAPTA